MGKQAHPDPGGRVSFCADCAFEINGYGPSCGEALLDSLCIRTAQVHAVGQWVNQLVQALLKAANVDHRLVAPWKPRANGLAERTVGNVKLVLKKKLEGMLDRSARCDARDQHHGGSAI